MKNKIKIQYAFWFSMILLILGVIAYFCSFNKGEISSASQDWGGFGAYLSGIASIVLIILGYFTISEQGKLTRKTLSKQDKQNQRQKIESTFMTMLDIVRQNSDNIYSKGETGRYVFVLINNEFNELVKIFYDTLMNLCSNDSKKVINIIWVILFYGVSKEIEPFLKIKLNSIDENILNSNAVSLEINKLRKNHDDTKVDNVNSSCNNGKLNWLKFDGYQNQLGHYYQHLYQTVTFIDSQKILKYDEKKEYIKTVRAQLSVYELILFYYNTLSDLGKAWEDKGKDLNLQLVTKYRLLKNIPLCYIAGDIEMSPEIFYPKTLFTGQEDVGYLDSKIKKSERNELENKYS